MDSFDLLVANPGGINQVQGFRRMDREQFHPGSPDIILSVSLA